MQSPDDAIPLAQMRTDLARAHPDRIRRGRTTLPPSARQQQVIELTAED